MANFWRRVYKLMITVLHTSVFVMLLIAIINKNWLEKETSLGTYHQGLWHTCVGDVCLSLDSSGTPIKYESKNIIRVTLILGALFGFLASVLSIKVPLKFVAIVASVSCSFVTSGMAIFTNDTQSRISRMLGFQYDWAFILGWICVASGFLSTIGTSITACLLARNSDMESLE